MFTSVTFFCPGFFTQLPEERTCKVFLFLSRLSLLRVYVDFHQPQLLAFGKTSHLYHNIEKVSADSIVEVKYSCWRPLGRYLLRLAWI